MKKLLYLVGEAIAVYIDDVDEVSYPKGKEDTPSRMVIKTQDGKEFTLSIKEKMHFVETKEAI